MSYYRSKQDTQFNLNFVPIIATYNAVAGEYESFVFTTKKPYLIVNIAGDDGGGSMPNGGVGGVGTIMYNNAGFPFGDVYLNLAIAGAKGANANNSVTIDVIHEKFSRYFQGHSIEENYLKVVQGAFLLDRFFAEKDMNEQQSGAIYNFYLLYYLQVIDMITKFHDTRLFLPPGTYTMTNSFAGFAPIGQQIANNWNPPPDTNFYWWILELDNWE